MDFYLTHGVVYSDDKIFVMAIMHNKDAMLNNKNNKLDILNCWYVHYAAGDILRLFEIEPHKMEWVIFERGENKPIKCYKIDRIRRLVYGRGRKTTITTKS